MDATGGRTPRAGAASTPSATVSVEATDIVPGALSGDAVEDLICRGHALLFLPGPLFDERPAVAVPDR